MDAQRIDILLQPEDVGFSASVPQLPGVVSQGNTRDKAIRNTVKALLAVLRTYAIEGKPVPWVEAETVTTGNPNKGD